MSPLPPPAGPPDPTFPAWLRALPLAPEYRPTESEFADPIGFLSRIEREAAAYGICKVIPPYPRPSRRFVLAHLNRSLASSDSAPSHTASSNPTSSASSSPPPPSAAARFTTRHQELGTPRRGRPPPQVLKQVWQSGEQYTLEQFEAKSRAFSKTHLSGLRDPTPLEVESLFWKASADRPIYIEYANDVPGSCFAASSLSGRRPKKRKREGVPVDESERTAGWRLSSSPWNLQAIARAPGSLTRFMPDDVPGVTSPMVYIGMLFSWFAWHVEDHELHSLNFLHTGAPKTWYAVPGDRATELEEAIRVHGYGGNPDRLAALAVLGEKTTLMSPEVIVASGLPCCRLVQHPGEFVVTFPRAYHVGFSHGFNCGEAANFATPQWLKFAREAAVRRAVMNYLPMLSHQQLLYLLAVSFISRNPKELSSGIRTSRLRDRRKEERELLVKQEFLQDMISENELLCSFLGRKLISSAVLWEPDLLPSSAALHSCSSGLKAPEKKSDDSRIESSQCNPKDNTSSDGNACITPTQPELMSTDSKSSNAMSVSEDKLGEDAGDEEGDLPFDLRIDSGSLTCVACGILGYPFMAVLQPSRKALEEMSLVDRERFKLNCDEENSSNAVSCSLGDNNSGCPAISNRPSSPVEHANFSHQNMMSKKYGVPLIRKELDGPLLQYCNSSHSCSSENNLNPFINTEKTENKMLIDSPSSELRKHTDSGDVTAQALGSCANTMNWNTNYTFGRPRIFCLQHALEIDELLDDKGGAHALVICHSDYTKLKALAISIAEEIEFQFDCKDVPLVDASKSDLHLINISIDEEGHGEDGRDWTSQMGLNMKYFAKLRKETSGSQEQHPLSLWGVFSKPAPISVVPNLKWLCRRARTPYKVVGLVTRSNAAATSEKVSSAVAEFKMRTARNASENGKTQRNFPEDALMLSADMGMCSEENDQSKHSLTDVPIAVAKYPMMHQVSEGPVSVGTFDGSVSLRDSHGSPSLAAVSSEFTIEQEYVQSAELSSSSTFSAQQFLDIDSVTEEGGSKQDGLDSCNGTSECKDKLLQVQQDQENMVLSDDANRNLVGPCSMNVVSDSEEPHCTTMSAIIENGGDCAKTSYCADTALKANKPVTDNQLGSVQCTQNQAFSGGDGKSVQSESNSFDVLLGALAEESKFADAPGKDEVGKASLTLMTLASNDHSADDVTKGEVVKDQYVDRPDIVSRSIGSSKRTNIICYVRRKRKRKRKSELSSASSQSYGSFARAPCESLRPRTKPAVVELATEKTKTAEASASVKGKRSKMVELFQCDIDSCDMTFDDKAEFRAHQRNICTDESCGKRFSSHKYLKRHQCVHSDARPFKCPWDGCGMTFKWLWAQTEHVRVHTGERPYECTAPGCGQRFRYVSDYSRHRKKFNHY